MTLSCSFISLTLILLTFPGPTDAREYVHVDISSEFSHQAISSINVLFGLVFASLTYLSWRNRPARESRLVALLGSLLMILLRKFFEHKSSYGNSRFDLERGVLVEPVLFLWASMLLTALIGAGKDDTVDVNPRTFGTTFLRSAFWIATRTQGEDEEEGSPWIHLAKTMGSSLFLTGSVSAMAISVKAYDEIPFTDFAWDMVLPVLISTVIGAFMIAICHYCFAARDSNSNSPSGGLAYCEMELQVSSSTSSAPYSPIALQEMETADEAPIQPALTAVGGLPDNVNTIDDVSTKEAPPASRSAETTHCWGVPREEAPCLVVLAVLYAWNRNVIMALLSTAALLALVKVFLYFHTSYLSMSIPSMAATPERINNTIATLDYGCLLWHISLMIVTSGWSDTGVPQAIANTMLRRCAEQVSDGWCQSRATLLYGATSALLSPLPAVLIFGDTFPYASPYSWVQLAFAVSVGGSLCLLAGEGRPFWANGHWTRRGLVQATACLLAWFVGSTVLQRFHYSFECSVRLGECGQFGGYV